MVVQTGEELKKITGEMLKLRQFLQDGRKLTDHEYKDVRSHLEALLLALENNFLRGRDPHRPN